MKYSFADLGDIIRGKDLWNKDKNYKNIQDKIRYVFDYMHKKLNSDDQKRYKDLVNHYDLRSDWWDANRKEVWKAMTCAAPRNAYIYKTTENSETTIRSTDMYYYCGHKDDPPDNDYIPQKLRWMTEWSEYFCKELNRKLEQMKTNCDSCKLNDSNCRDSNDGNNCRKCQQNCQEYTKLVNQGKKQFILQDNQYKEIYKKISNNSDGKEYVGTHVVEFLKKVEKNKCSDLNSADKYLYKGSNCKNLTFTENDNEHRTRTYAFTEKPIEYKNKCTCEITNHPLDKCPTPQNRIICNNLNLINSYKKNYTINLKEWNNNLVPKISSDNYGVLVPPRRKHLCLRNITANFLENKIYGKEKLRNAVLNAAYNEAYFLWTVYNKDSTTAFEAIKYSFADYGDIIKGTDIMESSLSDKIGNIFTNTKDTNARSKWWNEIKHQVWHAMLCGYRTANDKFVIDADTCKLPTEDEIPQFLRWLIEWAKQACKEYRIRKIAFEQVCHCSTAGRLYGLDLLKNHSCNYELTQYIGWNTMVKQYMDGFNIKFQKVKNASTNSSISENSAQEYIKGKIKSSECDFNDMKNIYEKITNRNNKDFQEILGILCPNKKIHKDKSKEEDTSHLQPPPLPLPADEPFDPTILQTTIPFGVALALGSIAFLFLKKKAQSPVDLFSVINIPKGDYDIPTLKSSNRYIPYASDRYKGKTYIYMEGDSSGDEKYAFMSDTTDVTSSESEYEELDINDIYVPGSPKYKTLIEVVLEPSKRDIQTDDIPTNKFTDDEWKQLKHDFISNMLQNEPNDVSNDYKSADIPLNTQPNTLYFNKPEEKPFITSIHDRNLYSGEEYNYNVNMVNSMDDIPINRDNNPYSGIDLINDSLNNNKVDIYDELLKRKENELFGTNHPKHTNTQNVTKSSNSDPIDNRLDLFHTWLDRHRDMCEKWNNKKELLDKLKEEWNKDNNSGDIPSDSNKTLNTDVSIQIHMDNPKPINEFTNMDTILEDLEKYNEPYYDVQDDIYYDVNDHDASTVDSNAMDVPSKVQIEMDVNTKLVKEKYPIADVWDI
ncbi:erythrocyte membrane protein 1, PfEMP1, putative [Plasmodium sp. gorilla clade G1]|nr:erythrocyte membrane protein 1, PfEMP1, putative [Plasmodium sp. gorilla clade G1]